MGPAMEVHEARKYQRCNNLLEFVAMYFAYMKANTCRWLSLCLSLMVPPAYQGKVIAT